MTRKHFWLTATSTLLLVLLIGLGLGAGCCVTMRDHEKAGPDFQHARENLEQDIVGLDDVIFRTTPGGAKALISNRLEIIVKGRVLGILQASGDGQIVLESAEPDVFPFLLSRNADGSSLDIGGPGGHIHIARSTTNDGSFDITFIFQDANGNREFKARINPKGDVVFTNRDKGDKIAK